ncbi:hypothetical protein OB905_03520 [Halobacteria archaeon AArc-dxtr1]|nr:hypothetical protein [Halobacteria archaeon AArc-dxtr1]
MARERPVQPTDKYREHDDSASNRRFLNRRSYLKMAGVAAAGLGAAASAGSAGATEDYEVIEARGQVIRLDDGEVFENKIIDFGNQNSIQINATSGSHTIRNVGTIGTFEQSDQLIAVNAPAGETVTIENCYFGEGDPNASFDDRGREIWVSPSHAGSLEIRRCNFNLENNMAIYGCPPNRNSGGAGGSVLLEDCYAIDPHHSGWRVCGDDTIRNCVIEVTEGAYTNRGIYIEAPGGNPGAEVTVENSHVVMENGGTTLRLHSGASVDVTGGLDLTGGTSNASISGNVTGTIGSNPQLYVPEGVPQSAEEAATGAVSNPGSGGAEPGDGDDNESEDGDEDEQSDGHEDLPENALEVIGNGEPCQYTIRTESELSEDPDVGEIDAWTEINGDSATGWVTVSDRTDGYRFDGDLLEIELHEGSAVFELNGEQIDPDEYPSSEGDLPENLLEVIGNGEPCRYTVRTENALSEDPEVGEIDAWTEINGDSATGWVTVPDRTDGYRFDGDLLEIELHEGSAVFELNGEQIDPADYSDGDDGSQTHLLEVIGNGQPCRYTIRAESELSEDPEVGEIDAWTEINGDSATGWVTVPDRTDGYRFDGDLLEIELHEGSAVFELDGEEIDPADYAT